MALVKLGSVKKTDLVISGSVNLSTDVGSSILPVANGGTGSGSFTNGQLLIGNTTGNTLTKATLTGTSNQVIVTNGGGSITLSLPQDIGTASNVTFGGITIASGGEAKFPNNGLHISDSSESGAYLTINCVDVTLTSPGRNLGIKVNDAARTLNLTGNATLDQDVSTVGSPTFGGLTLTTPLSAANGGTGITSLGTNVATALGVNVGSAGAFVTFNGALGTPISGTVTNLTGTASININGTVGATTPAAGTFTSVTAIAASTQDAVKLSPRAGGTGSFLANITTTTLTASRTITIPDSTGTIVLGGGTCSGACSGTNTGDQTSVSGNAGTATALQTARAIYGNNFDGTAALTQVIASTYGGTGNGFTKFSGPTTAERTKTLRDASDTILELGGSYTPSGTWTSLTMVTPVLGTPTSGTLTNCTGLPVSTGISGLGTGVATALAVNVGSAGAFVTFNGALGTPSSGTVTNLTGTASININGTVGATTPAAGTFTDLTINGNTIIGDASGDTVTQNASTTTIPNALTYVRTHVDSSAETLFTVRLDEDTGSSWAIVNGTANNATFAPKFQCVQSGTSVAANFTAQGTTDTGTSPVFLYVAQIGSSNVATRPCHVWRNLSTDIAQMTASYNFVLKGGTTSPVKDAATADTVALVGVDNGAGNRELQVQPESGGYFAMGNNQFRRVPTANQDVYHWTPTVNTTDATQTTLATIPITASRTYMIEARVAARRTGGSAGTADDGASYSRRGTYTTKSGTVTLMGSVQTIGTDAEDQAAWDVTLTISTTNVLVRVTGAANNNVTWMGDIKVQSVAS